MGNNRTVKLVILVGICLAAALASCSKPSKPSSPPPKTLAELDAYAAGKSSEEVAKYVFDNYGCNSCHTPGKGGKLEFTARGEPLRQGFEGCVSLLTSMNVMIHVPEEKRTPEEKVKYAHFQEYGCAFCHQVKPGSMGLTEVGTKLVSLHLSCPEVEKIISQR